MKLHFKFIRKKTLKKFTILIAIGILIFIVVLKIRALFFLPDKELIIIAYEKIDQFPDSDDEIYTTQFHKHISDLNANGFTTILPSEIEKYKEWGSKIPESSILLILGTADKYTIETAVEILKIYEFSTTICIPDTELKSVAKGNDTSLISKEQLLAYKENDETNMFDFGIKLTSMPKSLEEVKELSKLLKEILDQPPNAVLFPEEADSNLEFCEDICSAIGADIGIHKNKENNFNIINSKTNLFDLKHQTVLGNKLTFSIKAFSSTDTDLACNIFIAQPIGPRFKSTVSVYDAMGNVLLEKTYDELPQTSTLLGALPKPIEYPITVYITDETGIILYFNESFTRYTIKKHEKKPYSKKRDENLE